MTFLHPLLLFGLAAAAIPALLHLFERRPPPEAEFPPLRYLSEAERQSARRLKLQHLLLLLLRTALIVLVVLAAARPMVPVRASGTHAPTALVVVLDNSLSSGAVVDGRPVLDRLRAVARRSIAAADGAGDRLWLVLADGVARRGSRLALLGTIDSLTTSSQRLDLTAALELATRIVAAEPVIAREVHVVSDLQRTALGSGRGAVPAGVRVLVLAPAAAPLFNRGIGPIRATDGAVSVPLIGTPGASPGAVTVRLRGRTIGHAIAAPLSGISLPLPPLGPGWWVGEAILDPDELRADDRRLFVWHEAPQTRVATAPDAGPFVGAAVAVLRDARRVAVGNDVMLGGRPRGGTTILFPPADRASLGELNRALGARGTKWRYAGPGTPGPIAAPELPGASGVLVSRRQRIVTGLNAQSKMAVDSNVVATVNDDPWLVRDGDIVLVGSRLDTAWTALPRETAFVPFLDALINRVARGERPVNAAEGSTHIEFETRGGDTVGATVYGTDPRESDLTPAPAELVRDALGARALDEPRFAAARFSGTGQAEAGGWLLALALLVALVEFGVANLSR